MSPRDWTLLVIAASGRPLSPAQLQKSLFLLSRNLSSKALGTTTFYKFRPHDYGPFSADVYQDAETLESEGFIRITRPPETRFKTFGATEAGRIRASQLRRQIVLRSTAYLDSVVAWVQSLTFNQMVSAIYRKYPEMRVNSVFQELSE